VASPTARRDWVVDYVKKRYGSAPITVFYDTSGRFFDGVRRSDYYPAHAAWNKAGTRIFRLGGYPYPLSPRS
jgi:hypothetical protein